MLWIVPRETGPLYTRLESKSNPKSIIGGPRKLEFELFTLHIPWAEISCAGTQSQMADAYFEQ
jgi:hypothetical protein